MAGGAAVLLDFPLPLAMYKKLLGQVPTLRDLTEFDPTLGRSLQALLDYAGTQPKLQCSCIRAVAVAAARSCSYIQAAVTYPRMVTLWACVQQ